MHVLQRISYQRNIETVSFAEVFYMYIRNLSKNTNVSVWRTNFQFGGQLRFIIQCFVTTIYVGILDEPFTYEGNFIFVSTFNRIRWLRKRTFCRRYQF